MTFPSMVIGLALAAIPILNLSDQTIGGATEV
jgi:hypothetical protein